MDCGGTTSSAPATAGPKAMPKAAPVAILRKSLRDVDDEDVVGDSCGRLEFEEMSKKCV